MNFAQELALTVVLCSVAVTVSALLLVVTGIVIRGAYSSWKS